MVIILLLHYSEKIKLYNFQKNHEKITKHFKMYFCWTCFKNYINYMVILIFLTIKKKKFTNILKVPSKKTEKCLNSSADVN